MSLGGELGIVKMLVGAGARLDAEALGYGNAADHAARKRHHEIVAWPEQRGSTDERRGGVTCRRAARDRLGWSLFERHVDIGNGEHSLLFVEADPALVAREIAEHLEGAARVASVSSRPARCIGAPSSSGSSG